MTSESPISASVAEIATLLEAEVVGDSTLTIDRISALETATSTSISFLANPRYRSQLQATNAGCVILAVGARDLACPAPARLLVADPYRAYARLTRWWAQRQGKRPSPGIHPSAVIDPDARVNPTAVIGPLCSIAAGAEIGPGVNLGAHVVVGEGAKIGADANLKPRVVLGDHCVIGERAIVHSGAVIGADGFGFAPDGQGAWEKIAQLGAVRIGDDVEIGANTCIDRGAIGDTVIGNGVKLDNLIQIGHNVQIGDHTVMAGCVGVAGSARIGARCMIGGGANIVGHLEIVDGVTVSALTTVSRSILKPGHYSGMFPFDDNAAWEKNAAALRHLYEMRQRLRALEQKTSGTNLT